MGQFDALSPVEFEDFVAALMSKVTGHEFRVGAHGGDRGIDALAEPGGRRHVIQCKHYVTSKHSHLMSAARKAAEDLADLEEPLASYRFVTSMELSHTRRKELAKILEPWIGSAEHVLSGKELDAYLREHDEVERGFTKLWFRGRAQLSRVMSAALYRRSEALLAEIEPRLPRFVETEAFEKARDMLRDQRVCIVDGEPGVGKTTLARLLLVSSIAEGFEPFELLRGELDKAWEMLDGDEKQVFYFDDFLGHLKLSEARDSEQELVRFVRAVAADEKRRAVLTTRDYILEEGRRRSDELYRGIDNAHLVFLTPASYTRLERARMLYNHLHFSPQVGAMEKLSLVRIGNHLKVIDHEQFSPRSIEWITGFAGRLRKSDLDNYDWFCVDSMGRSLEDLWSEPFAELGPHERALLFAFVGLPDRIEAQDLELAFDRACAAWGLEAGDEQLQEALSALVEGNFVGTVESEGSSSFSLLNPSLLDLLERQLVTSRADTETALRGSCYFQQVEWVWDAWRKQAPAPPEALWPAFDEALSRVFASKHLREGWAWFGDPTPDEMLRERLKMVLDWCDREPALLESFSRWLPMHAMGWLLGVGEDRDIYASELQLFKRLFELELFDRTAADEMARRVEEMEIGLDRWEMLRELCAIVPGLLSDEEIERERADLAQFAEDVLDDPEYFYETSGVHSSEAVDRLLEVVGPWEIELDEQEVEALRENLSWFQYQDDKAEEEAEGEELEAEERARAEEEAVPATEEGPEGPAPPPSREDEEIEAMFSRFVPRIEDLEGETSGEKI